MQNTLYAHEGDSPEPSSLPDGGAVTADLPRTSAALLTLGYHSIYPGSCAGSQLPKTSPGWKHASHWLQLTDCQQTSMPV